MRRFLLLLLFPMLLAGCAPTSATPTPVAMGGSCTLALDAAADDQTQIAAVLRAEGEFVVAQDIDALMALWMVGGEVVDAKHTPADSSDDQRWIDTDAVRHRYVRTVFPGNPQASAPAALEIAITPGEPARAVVTATTRIGDEVSPGGDRWELQKAGDCWLIERLSYNLEAP